LSRLAAAAPIYAEWQRGDFRSTEWADPEIEFVTSADPNLAADRPGRDGRPLP
jgi:hypothetical protein